MSSPAPGEQAPGQQTPRQQESRTLTTDGLLTQTRSVRKRLDLDRPVDLGLVRDCLRIALQAPTGGNRQNWQWVVVTDPEPRAAIGKFYRDAWNAYAGSGPTASPRVRDSAAYLAENMGRVPVMVIPCLELPAPELPPGNQAGLWASVLPATWSYMLAARARGLGTAWTSLHLRYEREVADLLQLPPTVRQAALIPTAYFTGSGFRPARRRPLEEVLHINGWRGTVPR